MIAFEPFCLFFALKMESIQQIPPFSRRRLLYFRRDIDGNY